MKPKSTRVHCDLKVHATAEAQTKAQQDLEIEDPDDDQARAIIKKAIAEGLNNEGNRPRIAENSRATDLQDSESKEEK